MTSLFPTSSLTGFPSCDSSRLRVFDLAAFFLLRRDFCSEPLLCVVWFFELLELLVLMGVNVDCELSRLETLRFVQYGPSSLVFASSETAEVPAFSREFCDAIVSFCANLVSSCDERCAMRV